MRMAVVGWARLIAADTPLGQGEEDFTFCLACPREACDFIHLEDVVHLGRVPLAAPLPRTLNSSEPVGRNTSHMDPLWARIAGASCAF